MLSAMLHSAKPDEPTDVRGAQGEPLGRPAPSVEVEELKRLEVGVRNYKLSWIAAGRALVEIRAKSLYRLKASSFEAYMAGRWNLSKRHGLDLVTGAGVADNVREVPHGLSLRAALKLARLPAEQQAECLRSVIAATNSRTPTAKQVGEAVEKILPRKSPAKKKSKPKPVKLRLSGGEITIVLRPGADIYALLREAAAKLTAAA